MASNIQKSTHIPPLIKTRKLLFVTQIAIRVFAMATTLAAAWLMLSNKETIQLYGIQADARYSYSPAFKFFAIANLIACAFSVLSLFFAFVLGRKTVDPTYFYYLFLHDLIMSLLLMAGCAAASAIGYVGKYGNSHTGWVEICDHFAKFCNRVIASASLSYIGFTCYLFLTVVSAWTSRQILA